MDIKQIIIEKSTIYVFTDNPEKDILEVKEAYNDDNIGEPFPLGYEEPELIEYEFLGNKYKCIGLWFDNEDIPMFFENFKK